MAFWSNYENRRPLTDIELAELAAEGLDDLDDDEVLYESDDSEQDVCYESDHDTHSEESADENGKNINNLYLCKSKQLDYFRFAGDSTN